MAGYTELLPADQVKEHTALSIGEHRTVVEGLFQVKAVVPYFRRQNPLILVTIDHAGKNQRLYLLT